MATNTPLAQNNLVLRGQIPNPHKAFFSSKIPISIYASDDGVTFTVYQGKKFSKTVPFDELRFASTTTFLWKKKVVIYSKAGIETIRCFASRESASEFCKFVNNKVAAQKKPFGPRFQLTQLEAPPEQKFLLGANAPREYDSAIDFLFDPEKWTDDILDKLEREISLSGPEAPPDRGHKNDVKRKYASDGTSYNFFSSRKDSAWNFYIPKEHLRSTVLILLIVILGIASAWQLGELPGMEPGSPKTAVEKSLATPPQAIALPEQNKPNAAPRALEQLVEIMQDDQKYRRIVEVLRQKRVQLGLSMDDVRARMTLEKRDFESFEDGVVRLTLTELIQYSLIVNEDIHDLIKESNEVR
jgi:hypothetical protein